MVFGIELNGKRKTESVAAKSSAILLPRNNYALICAEDDITKRHRGEPLKISVCRILLHWHHSLLTYIILYYIILLLFSCHLSLINYLCVLSFIIFIK
jgi:hypothetical protein